LQPFNKRFDLFYDEHFPSSIKRSKEESNPWDPSSIIYS